MPAMHGGVPPNTGASSQSAFATHISLLLHVRHVLVLPLELELMQGSVPQVVARLSLLVGGRRRFPGGDGKSAGAG